MTTHTVGEFKARFSTILGHVRRGQMVGVRFGKAKRPVAFLVRADRVPPAVPRKLGPGQGKTRFRLKAGFKMTAADLLGL